MTPTATDRLAEGKTKILYQLHNQAHQVLVHFKDSATAFNAQKCAEMPGKGALNAEISRHLFELLAHHGIPTCYIAPGELPNTLIYKQLTMIPLEVVVRNKAQGTLVKRFGFTENEILKSPLIEFFYKTATDPLISEALILQMNLLNASQLETVKRLSLQINELLLSYFAARQIDCIDFKLEFGLDAQGLLVLGDEMSPDNFRLRDTHTGEVLDKDVFRLDLGDLLPAYQTVLDRLKLSVPEVSDQQGVTKLYRAEILVHSRKNILNPESKAILEAVHTMGFSTVQSLQAGKRFVLQLQAASIQQAGQSVEKLAETLLSNPVIEDFQIQISPVAVTGLSL
jgi:phosphoribosylaminoimidazole-succinocarboxamide synthase